MSLNVSANAAPVPVPAPVSDTEPANRKASEREDYTRDNDANSLFKKGLREVSDSGNSVKASESPVADSNTEHDINQLKEVEARLSDYLERQIELSTKGLDGDEGNGFPLGGSDLPAIAANIRQYIDDLIAAKRSGLQSGDNPSPITGAGGVALMGNNGLTGAQNLERQLTAIADNLARLGEGVANKGEAGQSLFTALSQVVKGLQSSNDSSNPSYQLTSQAFADSLSAASSLKANATDLSLKPLTTLGITTERFSLDSHQAAMTELAVKDLSTAQNAMLAVTGNMRNGAVQSAATVTNPSLTQAFNTQLELPLGSAQWGSQVLQRVAWLTGQGIAAAEIHLNPAELGPMQVRVDQRQDSATVVFTSHNSSTREAIEASLPRLRDLFSEQGMELIDVDINSGEQEANAQQSDFDSRAQSEKDDDDALLETQADGVQSSTSQTETIALHYGLIDAYA